MINEDFYRQASVELYNKSAYLDGATIKFDDFSTPTEAEAEAIEAKVTELKTEYDSKQYARDRKVEYNQLNQFELQFDDKQDGGTRWVDAINAIKAQFPKE